MSWEIDDDGDSWCCCEACGDEVNSANASPGEGPHFCDRECRRAYEEGE